ncbi:DUF3883 domain-containing protein [Mariprofundus sp. KV]|uniref:DUF3883 domain-containing protein n=1 Tax=Mariprofundus sp. KV TaxID=2608715 RepID=UPI0015A1E57B|nr:DUF3883 domain-containing protein [Mariprofundus sp. KV]NWF35350.1 DUF3883 domain-containing protein [Mariprofundus sp. KV]
MPDAWSEAEVSAIVEDYFSMLALELKGIPYNKAQHNRELAQRLNNRSKGSIEMKHMNISAIMHELGMPAISGYKPFSNYQKNLLPDAVLDRLAANSDLTVIVREDVNSIVQVPTVADILARLESPPELKTATKTKEAHEPARTYKVRTNYLELEASNKSLGDAGEQFALNFERALLISQGKESLADKIEHVAQTEGDGAGFDIRSYEVDGSDRFIEVKTTKYGRYSPFFLSANELRFSEMNAKNYHLHRIFQFRDDPRLFSLSGSVEKNFNLSPTEYRASLS